MLFDILPLDFVFVGPLVSAVANCLPKENEMTTAAKQAIETKGDISDLVTNIRCTVQQ